MSVDWRTWAVVGVAALGMTLVALSESSSSHDSGTDPVASNVTNPTETPTATSDDSPTSSAPPSTTPTLSPRPKVSTSDKYVDALAALRGLPFLKRNRPTDYVRKAFGNGWIDTDGNGCNQRDDVLKRDVKPGTLRVVTSGACDHDVVSGTWVDPYTKTVHVMTDMHDASQARTVQIDHVVPLAEAWVSGANGWSLSRREAFANDLSELLAVDGSTNESKGDGDPAAWRPRKAYQCAYAEHWIAVKSKWRPAHRR